MTIIPPDWTDNKPKEKGQKGEDAVKELREGHFSNGPPLFLVQKPSAFFFLSQN